MNSLTGTLIDCINKRHSGHFVLMSGTTVPFTLIQGIDGKTNLVTYVVNGLSTIQSLRVDQIVQVRIDVEELKVDGADLIRRSAALRGAGRFEEAISLIEESLSDFDPDIRLNGLLELFNAAREKGDMKMTKEYAALIAVEEPDLPSIQGFLR